MPRRWGIALLAALAALAPCLEAQVRGTAMARPAFSPFSSPVKTSLASNSGIGRPASFPRFRNHGLFLGAPFFYSDYPYASEVQEPQVVVVPAPATQPAAPEPQSAAPLTIELRGDRYARVSEEDRYSASAETTALKDTPAAGTETKLPPTVLVFRDATRAEVSGYAIVQGILYANADYWASGSWTRQIRISDLNVPATLEANRERGVKFVLPSGPNEVVTRP
jgi:hypothetical protein